MDKKRLFDKFAKSLKQNSKVPNNKYDNTGMRLSYEVKDIIELLEARLQELREFNPEEIKKAAIPQLGKDYFNGERGLKGDKGDKGDSGRDGIDGRSGIDGKNGRDGKDGKPGKDGAYVIKQKELSSEEIVSMLEALKGQDRLDVSAINGLSEFLSNYGVASTGISRANADERYVNETGDTMTGDLNFDDAGIRTTDYVSYNNGYTPGGEPTGTTYWDSANRTLSTVLENGVVGQHFKEAFIDGQNDTGATITNGTPVGYEGSIGNSGNFRIEEYIASASAPAFYFIGLVTEDVEDGNVGKITVRGKVRGIQTDGANYGESWNAGDIIYVSGDTAGYLTKTPPDAPIPAIPVALVISAHANNGTLEVRPNYPTSLSMLSDVNGTTPINGSLLVYDADNGYWDAISAYDDLRTPVTSARVGSSRVPTWTNYKGGLILAFADEATEPNEEYAYFAIQVPHTWKEGGVVEPHVHWTTDNNTAGNVLWRLTYSWANIGDAFPTQTTITASDPNPGTDMHEYTSFGTITTTGMTASSMMICSISRASSDAADTYTDDAYLLEIDFHYEKDKFGEINLP